MPANGSNPSGLAVVVRDSNPQRRTTQFSTDFGAANDSRTVTCRRPIHADDRPFLLPDSATPLGLSTVTSVAGRGDCDSDETGGAAESATREDRYSVVRP